MWWAQGPKEHSRKPIFLALKGHMHTVLPIPALTSWSSLEGNMWALRPQAARLFLILSVSFDAPALPGRPGLLLWCLPSGGTAQAASHAWHLASARKSTEVFRPLSGSSEKQHPSSGAGQTHPPQGQGIVSLADIALHRALTPAAGDVTAPVVLAVTSLHHSVRVGVVAAPTAHEVAAVTAIGGLVALPGGGGDKRSVGAHHLQHLHLPPE